MLDPAPNPANQSFYYQNWNRSPEFGAERKLIGDDDDSGIVSPPLWRTSPQHRQNSYRNLSPSSRAQAIARGQRELMEMVSKMPEGCYELSLKDIVEQQSIAVPDPVKDGEGTRITKNEDDQNRRERERKRSNSKKAQMSRSGSIDNGGFLLKMVFPLSFGTRKKKTAKGNGSESGRVSPRPLLMDGATAAKGGENEWWKRRYEETEESESGGLSSNNGSSKSSASSSSRSSSRNSTAWHGGGGCWSFLFRKREKKTEEKHK